MRTKIFLMISLVVLMVGATLSFANSSSTKTSADKKTAIAKNVGLKGAYLNGCKDLHFDNLPTDRGMLSTYQAFSAPVAIDLKAGVVTMPFYLTSKSGFFGHETSQIWDVEFFDAYPPQNGSYPDPDEADLGQLPNEFPSDTVGVWPNETHPSLVARSPLQTPDIPDATDDGSYIALTGDFGSVTLSRDVHWVRARLRADIYPDHTHNSVRARTVTFCAGTTPATPNCQRVDLKQNGVLASAPDGSDGFTDGILRYSTNPARNAPYSNTAAINVPAGVAKTPNIYTFDQNNNRTNETQPGESVALEFIDSNGAVIATTNKTPDLEDKVFSAYFEGQLNDVTLSRPAVGVRAVHMPDAAHATNDALNVAGATICYDGVPPVINTDVANPFVSITFTDFPPSVYELQTATVKGEIRNTGNIPLTDLTVNSTGNAPYVIDSLGVGKMIPFEFSFTVPLGFEQDVKTFSINVMNQDLKIDPTLYHWPPSFNLAADEPYALYTSNSQNLNIERIVLPA